VRSVHDSGSEEGREIARWFSGTLGATLLAQESERLFQGIRRFHGDTLLWLGPVCVPGIELDRCMVRHRYHGALTPGAAVAAKQLGTANVFSARIDALPVAPATLDAVVVHHGFECSADPRAAIREVAKALRPGGRMLVCAFNPWSFWGLRRLLGLLRGGRQDRMRLVSPARLLDWLAVLGFELDDGVHYLFYRPPIAGIDFDRAGWVRCRTLLKRWRLPVGGVYFVLARKSTAGLLPLKETRRLVAGKLAGVALPGSTARSAD
jgi:SAM-dependent methyltransferase